MLDDTGFSESWAIWVQVRLATRRAIREALALTPAANDPQRIDVLRRYVEWLNDFDEEHSVIDTVSREQLCPVVDSIARGLGLPEMQRSTWADPWRDW